MSVVNIRWVLRPFHDGLSSSSRDLSMQEFASFLKLFNGWKCSFLLWCQRSVWHWYNRSPKILLPNGVNITELQFSLGFMFISSQVSQLITWIMDVRRFHLL